MNKSITTKALRLILVLVMTISNVFSQDIAVRGKIIDENTGEPIPFCNIVVKPDYRGTFSNELGEFVIKVASFPATLHVTNIAFHPQEITIDANDPLTIVMVRASTILEEIVVNEKRFDKFAVNLAFKALYKTRSNLGDFKYGRAFYRQMSNNDSNYVELMEIFYDVKFDNLAIADWEVQEGRYAEDKKNLLNRNFTLLTKIFPVIQPLTDDIYLPLFEEMDHVYEIYVEDIIEVDEHRIAILSFTPRKEIQRPSFKGNFYIDIETFDVLKVEGGFEGYDLPFIKLTDNEGRYEKLKLNYEIAYKRDSLGALLLDFIKMNQDFDYYHGDEYMYPMHTESFLTFYDYYVPTKKDKKLGGQLKFKDNDRAILDLVGYNKKFWEDNPIVLRTPIEEEVINSFEENEAFGTIFLNSYEQIALNQTDIGNEPFLQEVLIKVKEYEYFHPTEKVHIHTDKSSYLAGESMWFAAYTVDANSLYPTNISGVLHVDLIAKDGKLKESQKIALFDGIGSGQFEIPRNFNTGEYLIRAYTQWMRNQERAFYFEKPVSIYNPSEVLSGNYLDNKKEERKLDFQFMPESGYCIENISSVVGFKAVDQFGEPIDVDGNVIDQNGKTVGFIKSTFQGMGQFQLKPLPGQQYFARIKGWEEIFPLPEVLKEGYVIHTRNNHPKSVKVRLVCSEPLEGKPVYIVGLSQGRVFFRQKFDLENGVLNFEIPKNHLPSGTFTITLFDSEHKPRSERMVFIYQRDEIEFQSFYSRDLGEDSDMIDMTIIAKDEIGRPVQTNFSLAVTDSKQASREVEESNIITQLWLESDVVGKIPDPGYFFHEADRNKLFYIDLILMTHGWRKYAWQEVLQDQKSTSFWKPEKGINIKGVATNPVTKAPMVDFEVALLSVNRESPFYIFSRTNQFGIFSLEGLDFTIYDRLIFTLLDPDGKVIPANIVWEPTNHPVSRFRSNSIEVSRNTKNNARQLAARLSLNDTLDASRLLDEVIVRGKKVKSTIEIENNSFVVNPNKGNRTYTSIFQLLALNAPGVMVTGSGENQNITLDGRGTPLIIVDGMEMNFRNNTSIPLSAQIQDNGEAGNNAINTTIRTGYSEDLSTLIGWITPSTVRKVEVLKRFNAAAYGSKGTNGVIIIHTKPDDEEDYVVVDKNAVKIQEKGFEPVKTFYQPKYSIKDNAKNDGGYPPTIYWLPTGSTNSNGEARVRFFAPKGVNLQFVIEGLSVQGKPGLRIDQRKDY